MNTEKFKQESKDKLVVVDFYATWCGPCKSLTKVLDAAYTENADKVVVHKIDIEEHEELTKEHNVAAVPTVLFFKNGELIDRKTGVFTKDVISKLI